MSCSSSLREFCALYGEPLATLFGPVIGAWLVYYFGSRVYYRQKEFELVRKRYLDDGLDILSNQVEHALNVFHYNYERCLHILKQLRDAQRIMPREILDERNFLRLQPSAFETSRHYILRELVNDDIYHDIYQRLLAFVHDQINFFMYYLCFCVKCYICPPEGKKAQPAEEIFRIYLAEMMRRNDEVDRFYILLEELRHLSSQLSRQRFSFLNIEKFSSEDCVKESIKRLYKLRKTLISEREVVS